MKVNRFGAIDSDSVGKILKMSVVICSEHSDLMCLDSTNLELMRVELNLSDMKE